MAKGRKTRVDGKQKAHDSRAKDLAPRKAREIAGGAVSYSEFSITKTTDKASPKLF